MTGSGDLRSRMQFLHPEKLFALWALPHRPEIDGSLLARVFAVGQKEYSDSRSSFDEAARAAAAELLEREEVRGWLDASPLCRGDVIVALGDSITDDYQSWAEILRRLLQIRRADDDIQVVNQGVSGDTTTDIVRRLWHVAAANPTWLIVLAGTNDARRDSRTNDILVSDAETARNLALIRQASVGAGVKHLVWMTPPRVHEARIDRFDRAQARELTWRNRDVAEKARLVRCQPDVTVDLHALFDPMPLDDLLLPDGLHPSLEGQKRIAAALLKALHDYRPQHDAREGGRVARI